MLRYPPTAIELTTADTDRALQFPCISQTTPSLVSSLRDLSLKETQEQARLCHGPKRPSIVHVDAEGSPLPQKAELYSHESRQSLLRRDDPPASGSYSDREPKEPMRPNRSPQATSSDLPVASVRPIYPKPLLAQAPRRPKAGHLREVQDRSCTGSALLVYRSSVSPAFDGYCSEGSPMHSSCNSARSRVHSPKAFQNSTQQNAEGKTMRTSLQYLPTQSRGMKLRPGMSRSPSLPSFRGKSSPCNSRLLPSEGLPKKSSPSFNNGRSPRSQLLAVPRGQQDISRRDPTPSARSSPYLDYPRYRDSPKNSCTPSPRRQTNGSTLLRASVRAADANEKRKIEEASRLPHSAPCTFNCSLSPLDQLEKAAQAELQKMSREMKQADEDMENKRVQRNTDCRYEFPNAMAMESSRDEPSEDKISDASSESEHLHTPFIVFNDHVPHDKQPQTPADLKRGPDFRSSLRAWARFRGVQAHDGSSTEGRKVSASRNQMPASEFSPGRNLSPSEQQPPASHAQVQQITSGIARTTHAGVVRSRHVFHGSNSSDPNKENSQEAEDIDGLSEERRTWMEREETSQEAVMDQTPPRLGRFERWMHE